MRTSCGQEKDYKETSLILDALRNSKRDQAMWKALVAVTNSQTISPENSRKSFTCNQGN